MRKPIELCPYCQYPLQLCQQRGCTLTEEERREADDEQKRRIDIIRGRAEKSIPVDTVKPTPADKALDDLLNGRR